MYPLSLSPPYTTTPPSRYGLFGFIVHLTLGTVTNALLSLETVNVSLNDFQRTYGSMRAAKDVEIKLVRRLAVAPAPCCCCCCCCCCWCCLFALN